ncbi:hypothetical protein BVY91_003661 [Salmonella enterica subsp. enterica serovar Poano]|nr:hypothetical protein [Salmonella enterica subsp. enterica]EDS3699854.1 hypothetical protein [Salmonella enterica]EDT9929489.1 hypothetical protein [Salmonella enterica subsp. enterica serovar Poano]EDW0486291.1 hypothetical protein [Salmonella enterica subsp. enterica serovar Poano]EDY0745448.1 hypothetical protein [Salmonella enterica subsp. enterica]
MQPHCWLSGLVSRISNKATPDAPASFLWSQALPRSHYGEAYGGIFGCAGFLVSR